MQCLVLSDKLFSHGIKQIYHCQNDIYYLKILKRQSDGNLPQLNDRQGDEDPIQDVGEGRRRRQRGSRRTFHTEEHSGDVYALPLVDQLEHAVALAVDDHGVDSVVVDSAGCAQRPSLSQDDGVDRDVVRRSLPISHLQK